MGAARTSVRYEQAWAAGLRLPSSCAALLPHYAADPVLNQHVCAPQCTWAVSTSTGTVMQGQTRPFTTSCTVECSMPMLLRAQATEGV